MSVSTSFADMVKKGKNFTILGDYTMGGIKRNKMNKHSKGNIHLKTFRGATCKDMLNYEQPTQDRAKSDGIIIHVGTNYLSAKKKIPSDIVDSVISVCKQYRDTGVRNVMISSLLCTKSFRL